MNKLLLFTLTQMFTSAACLAGNGHIGSGGDGSLFSGPESIPGVSKTSDTVVAPPRFARGHITVSYPFLPLVKDDDLSRLDRRMYDRERNHSNPLSWSALKCATPRANMICDYSKNGGASAMSAKINETIELSPGFYLVQLGDIPYSNLVEVKDGSNVEIKLAKLEVPVTGQHFTFSVFQDLTDPQTLKSFLNMQWLGAGRLSDLINNVCNGDQRSEARLAKRYPKTKEMCRAWHQDDPDALNGPLVRVLADGYFQTRDPYEGDWGSDKFRNEAARNLQPGEAVLVFPGTYGIEFKTDLDETSTQLGVKVDAE